MQIKGKITLEKLQQVVTKLEGFGIVCEPVDNGCIAEYSKFAQFSARGTYAQLEEVAQVAYNFLYLMHDRKPLQHKKRNLWGVIVSIPKGIKAVCLLCLVGGQISDENAIIVNEFEEPLDGPINMMILFEANDGVSGLELGYFKVRNDAGQAGVWLMYEEIFPDDGLQQGSFVGSPSGAYA